MAGVVDGDGGVVDRGDGDGDGGRRTGGRAVRCGVGEGVGAVVVGDGCVGERAVGVEGECAVAGSGDECGCECGVLDVGVVGEDVAGQLGVFVGSEGVVDCDRGVVDRGDGDGDGGRVAGQAGVRCGVGERV